MQAMPQTTFLENSMTIKEALQEIRSTPKWYFVDGIEDTRLSQTARMIERDMCKPETVKSFFERFGYNVEVNMEVRKA